MTKEIQSTHNMTHGDPAPLMNGIGARLKAAREAQHLSQKDAAARLHLKEKHIEILENEDFSQGFPKTFLKGYLRSYARLLNFSDDEINLFIEQLGMNKQENVTFAPTRHISSMQHKKGAHIMRWMTYIIIMVLGLLAFIRWNTHVSDNSPDIANAPHPVPTSVTVAPPSSEPTKPAATPQTVPTDTQKMTDEPTATSETSGTIVSTPTPSNAPVIENTRPEETAKPSSSTSAQPKHDLSKMKMANPEPELIIDEENNNNDYNND